RLIQLLAGFGDPPVAPPDPLHAVIVGIDFEQQLVAARSGVPHQLVHNSPPERRDMAIPRCRQSRERPLCTRGISADCTGGTETPPPADRTGYSDAHMPGISLRGVSCSQDWTWGRRRPSLSAATVPGAWSATRPGAR